MERDDESIPMDEWLRRLAAATGPSADGVSVATDERRAILEIARVAAHTSERVAAPISTYLLGLAMAAIPTDRRAAELERIRRAVGG